MGSRMIIVLMTIALNGCASQPSNDGLSSTEELARKWSQDYRKFAAHERFITYEKPKFWKDCISDYVVPDKGLRYVAFPAIYETVDGKLWTVVKPAKTIEIKLGSSEDNTKIDQEYLCQE